MSVRFTSMPHQVIPDGLTEELRRIRAERIYGNTRFKTAMLACREAGWGIPAIASAVRMSPSAVSKALDRARRGELPTSLDGLVVPAPPVGALEHPLVASARRVPQIPDSVAGHLRELHADYRRTRGNTPQGHRFRVAGDHLAVDVERLLFQGFTMRQVADVFGTTDTPVSFLLSRRGRWLPHNRPDWHAQLVLVVQQRHRLARTVVYDSTDGDMVLWKVLAHDGTVLWDASPDRVDIPGWDTLDLAVEALAARVVNMRGEGLRYELPAAPGNPALSRDEWLVADEIVTIVEDAHRFDEEGVTAGQIAVLVRQGRDSVDRMLDVLVTAGRLRTSRWGNDRRRAVRYVPGTATSPMDTLPPRCPKLV